MRTGFDDYSLSSYDFEEVIEALFLAYPDIALDELVDTSEGHPRGFIRSLTIDEEGKKPIGSVSADVLIAWCRAGEPSRWTLLAGSIPILGESDNGSPAWTEQAIALFESAPDPRAIVQALAGRLTPMSWSGSRSAIMISRQPLLDTLETHLDGADLLKFMGVP